MNLDNRRWSTRVKSDVAVRCRAASTTFCRSHLVNISYSGARVVLPRAEAEAGPFVEIELDLEGQPRFLARKTWQRPLGPDSCVVGLNFLRPGWRARAELALHIATRLTG